MTAVNGTERRAAAAAWRESVAGGVPLSGGQLGERYDRSPRWGRHVIAEARQAPADGPVVPPEAGQVPPGAPVAVRRTTTSAVALVAVVAAAASYSHRHALALEAGEGEMAYVLPLSVDGLVVAATMSLLGARRAGRRAGLLPWVALILGLGAWLAANLAAADPTVVGRLVAAWPPVALAVSFEMLLRQTRDRP